MRRNASRGGRTGRKVIPEQCSAALQPPCEADTPWSYLALSGETRERSRRCKDPRDYETTQCIHVCQCLKGTDRDVTQREVSEARTQNSASNNATS